MAESAAPGQFCQDPIKSIIAAKAAILRMEINHSGKAEMLLVTACRAPMDLRLPGHLA
jgi:hypothetical protein